MARSMLSFAAPAVVCEHHAEFPRGIISSILHSSHNAPSRLVKNSRKLRLSSSHGAGGMVLRLARRSSASKDVFSCSMFAAAAET